MKLIVGLGNPGKEYKNTRHNIGFMCIDAYSIQNNFSINKNKFNGEYNKLKLKNEEVIFLKPQSYMNLSGEVVKSFVDYFKINVEDILIISDDLDIQIGKYKLKPKGSSGGHNGLKNIELNLKTNEYKRLKIGISNNKNIDTKDYVLGKINSDDLNMYSTVFKITNNIIDDFLIMDFDLLMGKYNHK